MGCFKTSVRNYHQTLRNFPEGRRSHLLHGGSLKWRNGGVAPLVRNLGTGWRGMVSVTVCLLVPQESRSGYSGEENNVRYPPAVEPRISGRSSSTFRIKFSLCLDFTLYRQSLLLYLSVDCTVCTIDQQWELLPVEHYLSWAALCLPLQGTFYSAGGGGMLLRTKLHGVVTQITHRRDIQIRYTDGIQEVSIF